MAIEIVDLPIENGGSFHSYVNVYQRVLFDQQKQEANMASPHAMPAETAGKAAIGCRPRGHWTANQRRGIAQLWTPHRVHLNQIHKVFRVLLSYC